MDPSPAGGGRVANMQENKPPGYVQESLQTTLPRYQKSVHVGDRVIDKHSKREGVCLYVGPADFAKGKEVCGLRLDKKRSTTDCDGKYRGERYFRCTPGHGLYIPLEDAEYCGPGNDDDFAHMRNAGGGDGPPQGRQLARGPSGASPAGDVGPPAVDPNFDLEKELEPIVGLTEVKDMLRGISNAVEVRKKRAHMGVNDERTMHMLFLGNPGTGKTTVARLVARMLHALGILKKGQLIEVTRKVREQRGERRRWPAQHTRAARHAAPTESRLRAATTRSQPRTRAAAACGEDLPHLTHHRADDNPHKVLTRSHAAERLACRDGVTTKMNI